MQIDFYASQRLSPRSLEVVKAAKVAVFGDSPVRLNPVERKSALHLDNGFLEDYPLAQTILERRFEAYKRHPFGEHTLYLDIESHSVEDRWRMSLEEFFRLGQWATGDGPIETTTDVDVVLDLIRNAPGVVAHNGHAFDFSVLLGDEALVLGLDNRLFDTKVHAALALPAPYTYVDRNGHRHVKANKPEKAAQWLSLDNLCFQLGLPGKEGDLKALAKEFGGFGDIPTDDPRYLAYAVQDIDALRQLTGALLELYPLDGYAWREQQNAAIDAQNSRNGFCVDVARAKERSLTFERRRHEVMSWLAEKYDFPTEGAMPWRSNKGKEALFRVLADHGITPETRPDWQKTASGAPSLGGDVLIELTQGTEAEELGRVLAEVMGLRSLPDLALSYVQPDGKVHPEISALQRSGRKSTTKPGLTVWGAREGKDEDKAYFIASPGRKLVEVDYSNADQRILAGYSGDTEYLKRFEEGVDGHEINGRIMFGDEVYESDVKFYRNAAKAPGHAFTYGAGAGKLAATTGLPIETMQRFVEGMNAKYPKLAAWTSQVRKDAACGFVTNWWGRRMLVDRGREHSQAPALMGQSGTREIMVDSLIRLARFDLRLVQWLVAQVHDALVFDIPEEHLEWAMTAIKACMEVTWGPGQPVEFNLSVGKPADNWREAGH